MFRTLSLLAVTGLVVGAFALVGCTRTIYVVQNPDGSFTELDPEPDDAPDDGAIVIEDDAVAAHVLPSNSYVLVEDDDGRLYLQFELVGQEIVIEDRAPLNLGLVIDRSGSMTGGKMEDARAAALWVVRSLRDGDRVAVISYASDVTVDVPSTLVSSRTRGHLERAIERLYAAGGTYLSGGLEAGAEEIHRAVDRESLSRVILMSDGNANIGVTDTYALERIADGLRREGISVTTMGVGLDYNEDLMTAMAVAGAGEYYFIERSGDLERMFGRELESLSRTVARDTVLELALPEEVIVEDVYGYRHERTRDGVRVHLQSVAAGERRRLLMSLKMPRHRPGAFTVAEGRLSFRDEVKKRDRSLRVPPVKVQYTRDAGLVARSTNRRVVEKLEAVRNAEVRQQALRRLDAGDRAGAAQLVQQRRAEAERAAKAYGGAALAKEAKTLYDFEDDVQSAPAPASDGYKRLQKAEKAKAYDSMMR